METHRDEHTIELEDGDEKHMHLHYRTLDTVCDHVHSARARFFNAAKLRNLALVVGRELVPSFLRPSSSDNKLSPTAFLDGMRGLAAFFVFNFHMLASWEPGTWYGYGHDGTSIFWQLPILCMVYAGPAMVCLFFAVSGYSLSIGPLKARRDQSWEKMLASLSGSVFRRGLRLYLPPIVVSACSLSLIQTGVVEVNREFHLTKLAVPDPFPGPLGDALGAMAWWTEMVHIMTWPFSGFSEYYGPILDLHLWTIRVEYMSSLALYLVMVATSRMKTKFRIPLIFALTSYIGYWGTWEVFIFISGLLVAEIDTVRNVHCKQRQTAWQTHSPSISSWLTLENCFWATTTFFALWFLHVPASNAATTPGYQTLHWLTPSVWVSPQRHGPQATIGFWWAIGSVLLIWSASNFQPLQKIFTNCVSQYLGKISFALYICHGIVLFTIGDGTARLLEPHFGLDTFSGRWTIITIEYLVVLPVLIVISDIVWRLVDKKSVAFARWVQGKVFM